MVQPRDFRLVLASASPRRHELLRHLGVPFDVIVSGFDESSLPAEGPSALAQSLAAAKALEVRSHSRQAPILAADTIVVLDGEMLGKPEGPAEAWEMLRRLRGRSHQVVTGVALLLPGENSPETAHVSSQVLMRHYEDAAIEASIARGTPFDKAGGYGVQDPDLRPVEAWEGCYCSIMGLPIWTVARMLQQAGLGARTSSLPAPCSRCACRQGQPGSS